MRRVVPTVRSAGVLLPDPLGRAEAASCHGAGFVCCCVGGGERSAAPRAGRVATKRQAAAAAATRSAAARRRKRRFAERAVVGVASVKLVYEAERVVLA